MIRVLVVDDEPLEARGLRKAVRRAWGLPEMHIDDCAMGAEALERVEDERYDVVVVDRGLDDMDGIELGARIRKSGRDCALLMVTGRYPEPESECVALQGAFDDFVRKPYDAVALLWRVVALTRAPRLAVAHAGELQAVGAERDRARDRTVPVSPDLPFARRLSYLDVAKAPAHRSSSACAWRRLLIVADDRTAARAAAEALRSAGHPPPEIVESPEQLDEAGSPRRISIIAADGLSGAQRTCRWARARALAGVILLFAAADGAAALDAQADRFWARQWGVERLGEALSEWAPPWPVRIGADGNVYLYGRDLGLRDTPLLLTCFLAERAYEYHDLLASRRLPPGRLPVVTREEMVRPVWGQETVSDHAVGQTVYRIRKAFGKVHEREARRLRTVAGRGFWLDVT